MLDRGAACDLTYEGGPTMAYGMSGDARMVSMFSLSR
jgi:hypothetical protein